MGKQRLRDAHLTGLHALSRFHFRTAAGVVTHLAAQFADYRFGHRCGRDIGLTARAGVHFGHVLDIARIEHTAFGAFHRPPARRAASAAYGIT